MTVAVWATEPPSPSMMLKPTIITRLSPTARESKAAFVGSTDRLFVSASKPTPASRPVTLAGSTLSASDASTSEAPSSRSTVNDASPSAAVSDSAPATTGASFVPVIVIVAVWATEPPSPSMMLKVTIITSLSPTAREAKAGSVGSTDSVFVTGSKVTPASRPSTLRGSTLSTSDASTSVAPSSRSTVNADAPSDPSAVRAASTTGSSFVPVIVTVMSCVAVAPLGSVIVIV